ncbi:MAG: hypothetical protein K8T89_09005 [Planctomycetes bacterium]|nr:hypothetical protein [Planctomycetota bacterium]
MHRRSFLAATGGLLATSSFSPLFAAPTKRLKVAAVYTLFRHRTHAHDILENFLEPCLFNGEKIDHGMDVGEYPINALGQTEYPRKRFFDAVVGVMKKSNRFVPIFNDKHLSYRWDWAKEMYDTSKKLGIPLMAGSSVPLSQRVPAWDLPKDAEVVEALSIHAGGTESYDFHGTEVVQSIIEARKGGETGIKQVEFLEGEALWKAADQGRWSVALAEKALAAEFGKQPFDIRKMGGTKETDPHVILLTYKDGTRGTVLKLERKSDRWLFACKLKGDETIHAHRWYVGPWRNRNLFKALSHAIQHHFREGKAPYPIERTLLTTGVVEAAMRSKAEGKALATPHLEFAYTPVDFKAMRETGASWKVLTEETPELKGITPFGGKKM